MRSAYATSVGASRRGTFSARLADFLLNLEQLAGLVRMCPPHMATTVRNRSLGLCAVQEMHQSHDGSRNTRPYKPPAFDRARKSQAKLSSDRPAIVVVLVVFLLLAAAPLALSFWSVAPSIRDGWARFFLYGYHGIPLAMLFISAILVVRRFAYARTSATTIVAAVLGPAYIVAFFASWLIVAFFMWWESSMWT